MHTKSSVMAITLGLFFVSGFLVQYVHALNIVISHGGSGEIELCVESNGYEDPCEDFSLSEWPNPFRYILDVEDPDQGHDFSVCYEVEGSDSDSKTCRGFEFTGSDDQVIDFHIPDIKLPIPDNAPEKDFSLQNPSNLPRTTVPTDSELPPVPSSPPP